MSATKSASAFMEHAAGPLSISSLFKVAGLTVLITGGASGIGRMFSEAFVRNGAIVYISSRNAKQCEQTAKELSNLGPTAGLCFALPYDLSVLDNCTKLAESLKAQGVNRLNVLINNSGVAWGQSIDDFPESGWDKVMNLNVKSVFFLTKALLPLLEAGGSRNNPARIINIGSIAGLRPQVVPTYSYDVSKAALHMLTQKLACDLADRHITVNAIAPGFVPSKMSKGLEVYSTKDMIVNGIPLARMGTPEDMAGAALYLSSRAGSWVTGIILVVDGGVLINVRGSFVEPEQSKL